MPVIHITSEAQFNEELKNNKYVVVDFFATWCGPCKRIAPELEKLSNSEEFKTVKFLKVDVDEQSEVAQAQNIEAMPTFKFFREGKKGEEDVVGADLDDIKAKVKKLASK
jgi:thioredoxin 1